MLTNVMTSALAPDTVHSPRMESSLSLCTDALKDLSKEKAASCAARITLYAYCGQTEIDFAEVKG